VDVVGQEELERKQPVNLEDILRDIPGVSAAGGSRAAAQTPNIRGFGGQRVVTTIDGARQNFDAGHKGGVFIEPDMLKQV
ncbi:TonB-dependent receptor plug domain-containing protein, partial [Acinetobacter baumannii]